MSGAFLRRDARGDIATPDHLLRRFGIAVLHTDVARPTVVMSMPIVGMSNPFTGLPAIGALAILVDAAAGVANHLRRNPDEWTVTTELALEVGPEAVELASTHPQVPVVASAHALGPKGTSSLSHCSLIWGDSVIGAGTVRSYFIDTDGVTLDEPPDTLTRTAQTTLADLMAVRIGTAAAGTRVLLQLADPILNNAVGVINGGIAAAGMELAASAALNDGAGSPTGARPLRTASLRVNFLRPFFSSARSRYEATPLRIGRGTAVADAHAYTEDGTVALIARLTAYR